MEAANGQEYKYPVYDESGEVERYNVFHASMLIRHANDGKMYLYDVLDIKKRATRSNHKILLGKNPFLELMIEDDWAAVKANFSCKLVKNKKTEFER